jgi:hypothetical protein
LRKLGLPKLLDVEHWLYDSDQPGIYNGAGLFIVNPPYAFTQALPPLLEALRVALAPEGHRGSHCRLAEAEARLTQSAPGLVDCAVGIGGAAGVGVGDGNRAKALAGDLVGRLRIVVLVLVPQGVEFRGIAVGPGSR